MKKSLLFALLLGMGMPAVVQAQIALPYERVVLTFATHADWPAPNMQFTSLNVYQGGGNGTFSFRGEVFDPNTGFPPNPRGLFAGPPENFTLIARMVHLHLGWVALNSICSTSLFNHMEQAVLSGSNRLCKVPVSILPMTGHSSWHQAEPP